MPFARPTRSASARGYGNDHRKLRRVWEPKVRRGEVMCQDPAPGCPGLIAPGADWDLAHDHHNRSLYLGPAHSRCNKWWALRKAALIRKARSRRRRPRVVQVSPWSW